jgi:hypothetical protein
MDLGRQAATGFQMVHGHDGPPHASVPADPQQQTITSMLTAVPPTAAQHQHTNNIQQRSAQQVQQEAARKLEEITQKAVAKFWLILCDFTIMHATPHKWVSAIAEDHPFLCRESLIDHVVVAPRAD